MSIIPVVSQEKQILWHIFIYIKLTDGETLIKKTAPQTLKRQTSVPVGGRWTEVVEWEVQSTGCRLAQGYIV